MAFSDLFEETINNALIHLSECLTVETTSTNTHSVMAVTGWQDPEAIAALATYLVALRACVIEQAGRICSELIGEPLDFANGLIRSVNEIVVQPTSSGESFDDWRSKWRNPWIAEGIWHCCMRVAMERVELHAHGTVIAVDLPHISPKDHGLDVTALYVNQAGELGLSLVETKAYRSDPNKAISDAVAMLKSIEDGVHDTRLRQMITSFRSVINEPHKQLLSLSLWKNERTLIPNPHYEANGASVQWHHRRSVFSDLSAPVVIMPHGVVGYDAFFDAVADEMRLKVVEIAAYV